MYKPEGVLSSLVTPFDKEGNIDEPALIELIESLCNSNLAGLGLAVNTGEFTNLTTDEIKHMTDICVKVVNGRKKVVVGALAPSLRQNLEIVKYAKEAGADAVLVSPAYYISCTDDGYIDYFTQIGAVGIPFIIFNHPAKGTGNITVPLLERLYAIDTFAGIKECDPSFVNVQKKLYFNKGRVGYLMGFVTMGLPHFLCGGDGGFFSAGCFAPNLLAELYTEAKAGHIEKALEIQQKVIKINDATMTQNHPAGVKYAVTLCGHKGGYTRSPLGPCTEAEKANIEKTLKEVGLI